VDVLHLLLQGQPSSHWHKGSHQRSALGDAYLQFKIFGLSPFSGCSGSSR
jgi:hypothetical protein